MSAEHTPDVVEFCVSVADTPDGDFNRIVVYDWFSRAPDVASPKGGNEVEVLVDGEAAWGRVADDLEAAEAEVQIATWICRPDIELRRPENLAVSRPEEREQHRLGAILERLAGTGVRVRLLVWGMVYTPIVDRWMRRWFCRGRDNIDVLEQDHPRLIGSHHQKTLTVDARIGYCGGMNLKENDWDSPAHRVWEPRRSPHAAGPDARRQIAARVERPKFAPRHDLMMRIVGPAVGDLVNNFTQRWGESLRVRRKSLAGRLVDGLRQRLGTDPYPLLDPPRAPAEPSGQSWVQIVRTVPGGERAILDAYCRAIENARRYIYIENQYFRSPVIGRALASAMRRNDRLRVAVVVWPVNEGEVSYVDPAGYWTAETLRIIVEARPSFRLTRLLVSDVDAFGERHWLPVDVHAKAMVIDDVWFTVGSANINDRGFQTEAEINAVALDSGLAADMRVRLMAEHLELSPTDPRVTDVDAAFDLWEAHAADNPGRRARGERPRSRVHAFVQRGLPRPLFGVGSTHF